MKKQLVILLALFMLCFGGCRQPTEAASGDHGGQPQTPTPPTLPAEPPSGEFAYIITYPPGAVGDIALYRLPDMADMGLSPSHVCESNGLTEWVELAAGSYLLTVQVTMGGRSVEIAETIAIYPAMLTEYDKEFFDSDFAIEEQTEPPEGEQEPQEGEPPEGEQEPQEGEPPEGEQEPTEPEPPVIEPAATRTVTVDMYTLAGNGWTGNAALRIVINGEVLTDGATVPAAYSSSYTFTVAEGDTVQFFWVAGLSQGDYSFIAYYTDAPPTPAFSADQKGSVLWNGANALLYRTRGYPPAGLYKVTDSTLLGEFTVGVP